MRPVPPTGRWHEDYERGRPGWPIPAIRVAGVPRSATVAELAAGTGKLTQLLVAEFARVIAIEPDPEMRRMLGEAGLGVDVQDGRAERIPLANASVDAVFVAEAFHWFDGERAVAEITRVLRPGGALTMTWNVPPGRRSRRSRRPSAG